MERSVKHEVVENLKKELEGVNCIFLCNFQGLTVDKDTKLRRMMRESGSNYSVVKNSLLKIAFADSSFSKVGESLVGNTAMAYNRQDPVALARLIRDFAKDNPAFTFKAGVLEGTVIQSNDLEKVANLPSKEALVSKLMYLLNYPVQGLVTALNGIVRNLPVVLDQIRQQKEQN